ncbi:MAG TPA: hypothetical protein VMM27_09790 [Casimicrobiaceae bacterium]|nr:hypothetical protein [Casimicrobiaceae bacterium]
MFASAALAFCLALGVGGTGTSFAADSRQPVKVWRIGIIANSPPTTPEIKRIWDAFEQGLRDRGYAEGRNLVVERRSWSPSPTPWARAASPTSLTRTGT